MTKIFGGVLYCLGFLSDLRVNNFMIFIRAVLCASFLRGQKLFVAALMRGARG